MTKWLLILFFSINAFASEDMIAHFIDMGQADATLLEFPCGAALIDAGAVEGQESRLVDYLQRFFETRPDLNETLNVVIITHNHIDHTRALKEVAQRFHILNYVNNGNLGEEGVIGTEDPRWIEGQTQIRQTIVKDEKVRRLSRKMGLHNPIIDPLICDSIDPQIRILSGWKTTNPGWTEKHYANMNNHSLVIRVDFGEASFLFTGDLELDGIESLLQWYEGTNLLDTDVYQVGHHGSYNATTPALLRALTPEIAVISVGKWNDGQGSSSRYNTWNYGHPRDTAVNALRDAIDRKRDSAKWVRVGKKSKKFKRYRIKKAIYATGWDGTIKIKASDAGVLTVM